jgi:DNA-binding HxlR family transcriptional regulator
MQRPILHGPTAASLTGTEAERMKDKKEIKKDILDKFRSMPEGSDFVISPKWLEVQYLESLSPMEKKMFDQAVKELIRQGLVEAVDGAQHHLKLTEKGENLIS